jgi:translation initiation factor 2 subunit 2
VKEYEELLDRAISQIPEGISEQSRFQIPEADVVAAGNRTTLRNFRGIASALNRSPDHLMKYLLKELGAAGEAVGDQAVFQGRFSKSLIGDKISSYVKEFVLCRECGKPDTQLMRQGRVYILKCGACGARASVRGV